MSAENIAQVKAVALGPNQVTFLLSAEQTGGKFSLTEFTAAPPPAPAAPVHIHHDADETLYILEGEFQFIRDGQTIPAPAGSYIFIPKGTRHGVVNIGTTPGRMLVILTPPGFEQFWRERAELLATQGDQVDPAAMLALQTKYHMDTGGQVRQFSIESAAPSPEQHESKLSDETK
jgi:quercetin dioxygenase-like cupin family protein